MKTNTEIDKLKSPSNKQVLQRFFALQNDYTSNMQKKKIAKKLLIEVMYQQHSQITWGMEKFPKKYFEL